MVEQKNRHGRGKARKQLQGDGSKWVKKGACEILRAIKENCKVVLPNDVLAEYAVELALDSDGSEYFISTIDSILKTAEPVVVTSALTGEIEVELALTALDVVETARLAIAARKNVPVDSLKLVNKAFGELQNRDKIYAINATEHVSCLSSKSPQKVLIMEWLGPSAAVIVALIAALVSEAPKFAGHATGNLVVQVLYESADSATRCKLTQELVGHIYNLSVHPYGCRVIQKALQCLPRDGQALIVKELVGHVAQCIESRHGNFVIQMCLLQMPPDARVFILEEVEDKTEYWAKHRYGCRVIQQFMIYSRPPVGVIQRILAAARELAMDRFGNYSLQHVLEHCGLQEARALLKVVVAHFDLMARDKYASNVVEKIFESVRFGQLATHLSEVERGVLFAAAFDSLERIVLDKYGNYVVQRMIECSCGQERIALFTRLNQLRPVLQGPSNRTKKSILKALEKETEHIELGYGEFPDHL